MNQEKLEIYLDSFYKDDSRMRYDVWNYDDGIILMAAIQLYEVTGKEKLKEFVIQYLDKYVNADGTIKHYNMEDYHLDNIAPGRALVFAYEQTGEERYRKAADLLEQQLIQQPRTKMGNFWHKKIYPNQVWLDGLYMAMPFHMAYDTKYGKKNHYIDIVQQFCNVQEKMFDVEKGLYYHGYDETTEIFWADKRTGCSANFWLRSIAWLMMGLVDTLEEMDYRIYDIYRPMADMYKEGIHGILPYSDKETGLFYQIVDKTKEQLPGNYTETSGSAMLAASMLKACRMRILLAEKYQPAAEEILESLIDNKLVNKNGKLVLTDTCHVAGLGPEKGRRDGSAAYYLSEPVTKDDKKGIATLAMAYAQYLKLKQK